MPVAAPWCSGMAGVSGDKSIYALSSEQVPAAIPKIVSLPITQRRLCGGLREMDSIKLQGPTENH